jgi:polysaccharide transporter, PST family
MTRLFDDVANSVRRRFGVGTYFLRVVASSGWMLAERVLRYALGFFVGIWLARYLGADQYGLLNYALALVAVLGFASTLGLDSLVVRDLVHDPSLREELLGTLIALRLCGGLLLVAASAVAVAVLETGGPLVASLVTLIALGVALNAFESVETWFQSALATRRPAIARSGVLLAAAILRIVLIIIEAPLIAFAWAVLLEFALLAGAMLLTYRRAVAPLRTLRPRFGHARALLREGWPLVASTALASLTLRLDQVLLGQFVGFGEIGSYALASRIVEVSYVLPTVLLAGVFPAMIAARNGDATMYARRLQSMFDALIWLALAFALPTFMVARPLVHLLVGDAYPEAGQVLRILAWMPLIVFFGLARQRWLIAEGSLRLSMGIDLLAVAIGVALNLVLIPRMGAVGAAWAAVASSPAATVLLLPFAHGVRRSAMMLVRTATAPVRLIRVRTSQS